MQSHHAVEFKLEIENTDWYEPHTGVSMGERC